MVGRQGMSRLAIRFLAVFAVTTTSAAALRAQPAMSPAMQAAEDTARMKLAPLKWLAGEWTGPASGTNAGRSYSLTQTEKVVLAAKGTALLIQGQGVMDGKTVFEAAGFLSYDMGTHKYRWVSTGGSGYVGISDAEVRGDTLVWFTPGGAAGRTRYMIWRTPKGEWRETGEVSKDNSTWTRTFEMTLVTKK